MSDNVSQENIQKNIQENNEINEKPCLASLDPSFFMTKEQKQRIEENEKLKDVKPVYYSITKATKLYGLFLQKSGKAYSAPVFQTVGKRYLHEFTDGNTVYIKRVEKIFKQNSGGIFFKPEKIFGNPKVYISIPTSAKKNYRDTSKIKNEDLIDRETNKTLFYDFIQIGEYKCFKTKTGDQIEYFDYEINQTYE